MSWIGGKKALRDEIIARFPLDYSRYIEVFGGSGAVLLGKPQDKFEVYNDLDGELYNLFCVIKDRLPEFLLELDLLPMNARDNFKECLRFYNGGNDPGMRSDPPVHLSGRECFLAGKERPDFSVSDH